MHYGKRSGKGTVEGVALKNPAKPDGPTTKATYKYAPRAEAARRMGKEKK